MGRTVQEQVDEIDRTIEDPELREFMRGKALGRPPQPSSAEMAEAAENDEQTVLEMRAWLASRAKERANT